jgi:hypothetical protein
MVSISRFPKLQPLYAISLLLLGFVVLNACSKEQVQKNPALNEFLQNNPTHDMKIMPEGCELTVGEGRDVIIDGRQIHHNIVLGADL